MTDLLAPGAIVLGRLELRHPAAFAQALASWKDGEVLVRVERAAATRSLQANKYYWAIIVELISEHTGHTPDETHEILKQMFLPKKKAVQDRNGVIVAEFVIGGSTTKLNTREFADYCARIRAFALEQLGVEMPDPPRR